MNDILGSPGYREWLLDFNNVPRSYLNRHHIFFVTERSREKIDLRVIFMSEMAEARGSRINSALMSANAKQIRAARAYMGWHQSELAGRSGVSIAAIKQIESGLVDPRISTIEALERAFREAGLLFIDEGEIPSGEGRGLRMVEREPVRPVRTPRRRRTQ